MGYSDQEQEARLACRPQAQDMNMGDITIVGTSHSYQVPGKPGANAFGTFVASCLEVVRFAAIAEEMSHEGLAKHGATESVCKRAADSRCLRHLYCDPDSKTRSCHGIGADDNLIRALGQMSGKSEQEIDRQIRESHSRREQYWLDRLLEFDCWPVLFVCGANHVDAFAVKARACGRTVRVLRRDWEPAV